jgi:REP element-mobilizing transposase RayT
MSGPAVPTRKGQRLREFDYTRAGHYFITVCTLDRRCLFGEIRDGGLAPSAIGRVVEQCWRDLPTRFDVVELDAFVLMPNHVHGLLRIGESARTSLPDLLRVFKSQSAHLSRALRSAVQAPMWQRGYYERIVRDEADLDRIRDYIVDNPYKWDLDEENPDLARAR